MPHDNDKTTRSNGKMSREETLTLDGKGLSATTKTLQAMQALIEFALTHLNYWWILVFMAIESSFIPFPSEVIVPPAAYLSFTSDSTLNIVLVVIIATIGADIGALINYFLARWLGRPIVYRFADSRIGHMCLIDRKKVEHAEEFFRDHGASSTFFGRLVPAVRQLISIPAGLAGMRLDKFLLFTTLGAGIWNSVLALLGYVIYTQMPVGTTKEIADKAAQYSHEIGYVILVLAIIVMAFLIYKGTKKSK